jgi:hypothetical protein
MQLELQNVHLVHQDRQDRPEMERLTVFQVKMVFQAKMLVTLNQK